MISVGNLFILNMQLLLLVERIAVFVFVKEKKNKKKEIIDRVRHA